MLVLPDIYVLKKEIIPRNNFIENNLINKFEEKKLIMKIMIKIF